MIANGERPEPLLAGVYWWAVMRSTNFRRALKVSGVRANDADCVLVAHAQNTRFDLLVLVEGYEGEPHQLWLEVEASELVDAFARATDSRNGTVADRLRQRYSGLGDTLVSDAIGELAKEGLFGVVIAPKPDMEYTSVPATAALSSVKPLVVPANAIPVYRSRRDRIDATVGIICSRPDGLHVSTALHAATRSGRVRVGNATGKVTTKDKEAYAKLPVKMIKQVCDLR